MICVGHYKIKPPEYGSFVEKNACKRTNNMLNNGLMYRYILGI